MLKEGKYAKKSAVTSNLREMEGWNLKHGQYNIKYEIGKLM